MSEWISRGRVFLSEARENLGEGHYWLACFNAHQAAEFHLKGLLVSLTGIYPFSHDLVELLRAAESLDLSAPPEVLEAADALTPHYTMARYPGRTPGRYDRERAERCISYAERIVEWVEKALEERGR